MRAGIRLLAERPFPMRLPPMLPLRLARLAFLIAVLAAGLDRALFAQAPGSVVCFGNSQHCMNPSGSFREIALGYDAAVAIRRDGFVQSIASLGYAGSPPTPPSGVLYDKIAIGTQEGIARRTDGAVVRWHFAGSQTIPWPGPGDAWAKVCTSMDWFFSNFSMLLSDDGAIVVQGFSEPPGVGSIPALPPGVRYTDIAAGTLQAAAVRSDGQVVVWGNCSSGVCTVPPAPPGVRYVRVAAGGDTSNATQYCAALRSDGFIQFWGSWNALVAPQPGKRYVDLAAGEAHVLALLDDGTLAGWGSNSHGQLNLPTPPPGQRFVRIGAGHQHSAALLVADCNGNAILDDIEIRQGLVPDCDGNSFPDDCDLADGWSTDCDVNGIPDSCDLATGTAPDCNGNGRSDFCDIAGGSSPDCNGNSIPDSCDIQSGAAFDCNANGVPDSCDLASGFSLDCNGNAVPDSCDLQSGASTDCNGNSIPDTCDLSSGFSIDTDTDGLPDECSYLGAIVCRGDGTGTACPCGNNGGLWRGCRSSSVTAGGMLRADGVASVSNDTARLRGSGMPSTSPVLYFQGTGIQNGGLGTVFGDGLRCAAGFVIRLDIEPNVAGSSQYPGAGDPSISVKGQVIAGGVTRYYQAWYRDAAAFCTPSGFNLTNAIRIAWVN